MPQAAFALRLLQAQPQPWPQLGGRTVQALPCVVAIDAVLREPVLHERWLPRAASLVPQLMRLLRQPALNQQELSERVARDVLLSAEVLRMASGPAYASRGAVQGLRDALDRLGVQGLNQAMARVVLRPVLSAEGDPRQAPLQALLQRHTDWQADALAVAATWQGVDAFDGFLAGLLHAAGWQALFRIVGQAQAWPSAVPDPELAVLLAQRAHRLFGRAARDWALPPAFQAFAQAAEQGWHDDPLLQAWARLQPDSPLLKSPP